MGIVQSPVLRLLEHPSLTAQILWANSAFLGVQRANSALPTKP